MKRLLLAAVLVFIFTASTFADDKEAKVKDLKKQLADAEKKVAELKKAITKEGEPTEFKQAAEPLYTSAVLTVGTEGALALLAPEVIQVVDDEVMVIKVSDAHFAPFAVVRGIDTKGFRKGMKLMAKGNWRVVGVEKFRNSDVFVLRPTDGELKEKPKADTPAGPGGPKPPVKPGSDK